MNNDALIWVIIVGVTSVGSNIAIMIGTFRRKPSVDADLALKADKGSLEKHFTSRQLCDSKMSNVKSDRELQEEFVTRREWLITEAERAKISVDLSRLRALTSAIAGKLGVQISE